MVLKMLREFKFQNVLNLIIAIAENNCKYVLFRAYIQRLCVSTSSTTKINIQPQEMKNVSTGLDSSHITWPKPILFRYLFTFKLNRLFQSKIKDLTWDVLIKIHNRYIHFTVVILHITC